MSTQKALVLPAAQQPWIVRDDWPISKPGPHEVLVKVVAAALNPADWKIQAAPLSESWVKDHPFVTGLDGAGIVEELGSDVTNLAKGEKILFPGNYNRIHATFQQYSIVPAANAAKALVQIPDNISFEQAASVPLGLATVAAGIWAHHPEASSVDFPAPWEEGGTTKFAGQPALVIGGASSVGQFAIQLAKIQGFYPILTTASLHNEAFLKSIGATHVLDRSLPFERLSQDLLRLAGGQAPTYIYDSISSRDTQRFAYDVLAAPGGALVVTLPFSQAFLADKIKAGDGKRVAWPFALLSLPGNRRLGEELYAHLTEWLATGLIVPNRVEVLPGGLKGIPAGLERMKENKVSGVKLVVRPQDTE